MDMICKGITEAECFRLAVEEHEAQLADQRAVSQALRMPLRQALRIFKWLYGYGGKRTMQHNRELCERWNEIVMAVKKQYYWWNNEDVDPEKLVEMNLYAINLMKEDLSV